MKAPKKIKSEWMFVQPKQTTLGDKQMLGNSVV